MANGQDELITAVAIRQLGVAARGNGREELYFAKEVLFGSAKGLKINQIEIKKRITKISVTGFDQSYPLAT